MASKARRVAPKRPSPEQIQSLKEAVADRRQPMRPSVGSIKSGPKGQPMVGPMHESMMAGRVPYKRPGQAMSDGELNEMQRGYAEYLSNEEKARNRMRKSWGFE